jgi:hypothetical protein
MRARERDSRCCSMFLADDLLDRGDEIGKSID